MITLRHPWLLLLLALVPLLTALQYRRARSAPLRFSDSEVLTQLPVSWAVVAHRALPLLYAFGLICLVLALARPQTGLEESRVHAEAVDIVLIVDTSTSMHGMDFATRKNKRNRLDAAKEVMKTFIESRPHDRISIVAFAGLPYSVAPLTLDHDWLLKQLDRIKIGMVEDGTAIGAALASGLNRLRESEAESKMVVLLTDGVNNAGSMTPENAAQAAKALGIKVYTVGAGAEGMVPYPMKGFFGQQQYVSQPSIIDEETLQKIAEITESRYFRAQNMNELSQIYADIDEMEKTEIEIEQFTRYEERFMPFAAIGLILLGLERLLGATRLGRVLA